MDTDRQVTMFLRQGRGQISHTWFGGGGPSITWRGVLSPVTFEHLVAVSVRLERLVPAETLGETTRSVQTGALWTAGGDRGGGAWFTWLHRDTWKMLPSLPPQNRK